MKYVTLSAVVFLLMLTSYTGTSAKPFFRLKAIKTGFLAGLFKGLFIKPILSRKSGSASGNLTFSGYISPGTNTDQVTSNRRWSGVQLSGDAMGNINVSHRKSTANGSPTSHRTLSGDVAFNAKVSPLNGDNPIVHVLAAPTVIVQETPLYTSLPLDTSNTDQAVVPAISYIPPPITEDDISTDYDTPVVAPVITSVIIDTVEATVDPENVENKLVSVSYTDGMSVAEANVMRASSGMGYGDGINTGNVNIIVANSGTGTGAIIHLGDPSVNLSGSSTVDISEHDVIDFSTLTEADIDGETLFSPDLTLPPVEVVVPDTSLITDDYTSPDFNIALPDYSYATATDETDFSVTLPDYELEKNSNDYVSPNFDYSSGIGNEGIVSENSEVNVDTSGTEYHFESNSEMLGTELDILLPVEPTYTNNGFKVQSSATLSSSSTGDSSSLLNTYKSYINTNVDAVRELSDIAKSHGTGLPVTIKLRTRHRVKQLPIPTSDSVVIQPVQKQSVTLDDVHHIIDGSRYDIVRAPLHYKFSDVIESPDANIGFNSYSTNTNPIESNTIVGRSISARSGKLGDEGPINSQSQTNTRNSASSNNRKPSNPTHIRSSQNNILRLIPATRKNAPVNLDTIYIEQHHKPTQFIYMFDRNVDNTQVFRNQRNEMRLSSNPRTINTASHRYADQNQQGRMITQSNTRRNPNIATSSGIMNLKPNTNSADQLELRGRNIPSNTASTAPSWMSMVGHLVAAHRDALERNAADSVSGRSTSERVVDINNNRGRSLSSNTRPALSSLDIKENGSVRRAKLRYRFSETIPSPEELPAARPINV